MAGAAARHPDPVGSPAARGMAAGRAGAAAPGPPRSASSGARIGAVASDPLEVSHACRMRERIPDSRATTMIQCAPMAPLSRQSMLPLAALLLLLVLAGIFGP